MTCSISPPLYLVSVHGVQLSSYAYPASSVMFLKVFLKVLIAKMLLWMQRQLNKAVDGFQNNEPKDYNDPEVETAATHFSSQ